MNNFWLGKVESWSGLNSTEDELTLYEVRRKTGHMPTKEEAEDQLDFQESNFIEELDMYRLKLLENTSDECGFVGIKWVEEDAGCCNACGQDVTVGKPVPDFIISKANVTTKYYLENVHNKKLVGVEIKAEEKTINIELMKEDFKHFIKAVNDQSPDRMKWPSSLSLEDF